MTTQNMSAPTSDPQRDFAIDVVRRLVDTGYEALWAGGCVRDLLLGRPPGDYDVATNATPEQVRKVFGRRGTIPVGESFGVILVRAPQTEHNVEVATFRADLDYEDGRRPTGVVYTTAEEDAQRRDFTINGMFYDPLAHRVIDYVGGEADLGHGLVRAIGDPHDRIREDKLRMLRAVRFAARFEFDLDETTAAAVREMAGEIHVVSVERIAAELKKMLVDRHRHVAVRMLRGIGLLCEVLPGVMSAFESDESTARLLDRLRLLDEPSFDLAFAALLLGSVDGPGAHLTAKQLKLSNDECDRIGWLVENRPTLDEARRLPLHELKPLLAHDGATELLDLARCDTLATGDDPSDVLFAEDYRRETPGDVLNPPPLVTGKDLIDRGLRPGPRFKELLETIRREQLDERLADRETALARLAEISP